MKRNPLPVAPEPCGSCPYRRDVPPGIWAAEEYHKLTRFAGEATPERLPALGTFLCHQTHPLGRETLCRGWLTVERESLAVRLGCIEGRIDPRQVDAPVTALLYDSGAQAAAMGLRGVRRPSGAAKRLIARLARKLGREEER